MKNRNIAAASTAVGIAVTISTALFTGHASARGHQTGDPGPARPAWVQPNGHVDLSKVPNCIPIADGADPAFKASHPDGCYDLKHDLPPTP